jgi:hypothetical protein
MRPRFKVVLVTVGLAVFALVVFVVALVRERPPDSASMSDMSQKSQATRSVLLHAKEEETERPVKKSKITPTPGQTKDCQKESYGDGSSEHATIESSESIIAKLEALCKDKVHPADMLDLLVQMENIVLEDSTAEHAIQTISQAAFCNSKDERTRLFCTLLLGVAQKRDSARQALERLLYGSEDRGALFALYALQQLPYTAPASELNPSYDHIDDVNTPDRRRGYWYSVWLTFSLGPLLNDASADSSEEEYDPRYEELPYGWKVGERRWLDLLKHDLWADVGKRQQLIERIRACKDEYAQHSMLQLLPSVLERMNLAIDLYWNPDSSENVRSIAIMQADIFMEQRDQLIKFYMDVARHDQDPGRKIYVLRILGADACVGLACPDSVQSLLVSEYRYDERPEVRAGIVKAMGDVPTNSAVDWLLQLAAQTKEEQARHLCYSAIHGGQSASHENQSYRASRLLELLNNCAPDDIVSISYAMLWFLISRGTKNYGPEAEKFRLLLANRLPLIPDESARKRLLLEIERQKLGRTLLQQE